MCENLSHCCTLLCSTLKQTLNIQKEWSHISWDHPLKKTSHGLPVVLLPLILYTDDIRGNLTRKWNKFEVWYLLLAGLSWKENAQLSYFQFRSLSSVLCIDGVVLHMCAPFSALRRLTRPLAPRQLQLVGQRDKP